MAQPTLAGEILRKYRSLETQQHLTIAGRILRQYKALEKEEARRRTGRSSLTPTREASTTYPTKVYVTVPHYYFILTPDSQISKKCSLRVGRHFCGYFCGL